MLLRYLDTTQYTASRAVSGAYAKLPVTSLPADIDEIRDVAKPNSWGG